MYKKTIAVLLSGLALSASLAFANDALYPLQDNNYPSLQLTIDNKTNHPVSLDGVMVASGDSHDFVVEYSQSITGSIDSDFTDAPVMTVHHTGEVCCAGYFGDVYGEQIDVTVNGSTTSICPVRENSVFDPVSHMNITFFPDDADSNSEIIMTNPVQHCDRATHMDEDSDGKEFINPVTHPEMNGSHVFTEPLSNAS